LRKVVVLTDFTSPLTLIVPLLHCAGQSSVPAFKNPGRGVF
jgi:hypothetical protein